MPTTDPPRLRLRPGLSVLAREPGVLQVGLDAPHRAQLPDLPVVRRLLAALAAGSPLAATSPEQAAAIAELERADLLLEGTDVPAPLAARHGRAAPARSVALAAARIGLDVAPSLRPEVDRLLAGAGLVAAGSEEPSVALVAADRTLSRARLDRWVRDGTPHLCLEVRDGGVVVGPLVVPGTTACLRCVDAHHGECDPRRPLLVEQLARRADPAPYDGPLVALALAWAVRDLTLLVGGERPATWSATVALGLPGAPAVPVPRVWVRHPHCGCAWDAWPARLSAAGAHSEPHHADPA